LFSFAAIRERSKDRFASVNEDRRISLYAGLRIWKAGTMLAPLHEDRLRPEPAAGNCSNKRATERFRKRLFAVG
jgi:hypothetical protein